MKKILHLFFLLTCTIGVFAQTTEVFETEASDATTFTDNGQTFNITTQQGGSSPASVFDIQAGYPGTGWNGTSPDNRYIDNDGYATAGYPIQFTISSASSFIVNNFWLYLGDQSANVNVSGSVTITGKLAGSTVYTATQSSSFNTDPMDNNGFSQIDLSIFGSQNNSNKIVDEIIISTTGSFVYVALDAFNWSKSTPEINIQGNSTTIADGDATPSTTDHTDFGSQSVCSGTIVRTFTIQNTGTSTLNISSVNITGTAAADYSVTAAPASTVAPAGSTTFQVTFNPSATGARNAIITVNNDDGNESAYDFAITGTGTDAEINIQGNSTSIADGDATPSLTDHTDFGSQNICSGTIVRTFTIQNTGTSTLNISSISITGTSAADYSVTVAPASTVAAAGSTTFQVTFNPSAAGSRNATITVSNSDCDEATYDFAVTGTGTDPEINLQGNSTSIVDGNATTSTSDHTDFSSQDVCSGTIVRTFTIQNTGTSTLNISSINITGSAASDYSVTTAPAATVAAAGSTTFQVTFDPSATGVRNATITVNNNDCDEAAYDFAISGTGTDPEINIQGNSNSIADGDATPSTPDHTDFGSQSVSSGTIVRTFTIQNTGTSTLNISSVNITGSAASDYSVTATPATTVAAAGSTTFQVTFDPSAAGARNATITVNSSDCDEAAYDFAITGTGNVPGINVQGNSTSIADGDVTPSTADHTDFGSQSICSGTIVRTFTIQNTGGSVLNISSVDITGTAAADYSVTSLPAATIASSSSTTFQVTFNPSATGSRNATITINNDDAIESTYDFAITGTGIDPEINVQGNSTSIANGDVTPSTTDHTDFGAQIASAGTVVRTFTIQNTGTNTLNISSVNITGAAASDYSVTTAPAATTAAAGSTTFQVTFDPSTTGVRDATITINNDDCNEAVYSFAITGTGTAPGINVQGNSITIANGDITPSTTDHTDFGSQSVCSGTIVRTFTIKNTGTSILNISSVNITGAGAADYSVTSLPAITISAAGSTTFLVTFNPSAAGSHDATISIDNDTDESTYEFGITGTGTDPEINVQGNSTSIADGDGTPSTTDHTNFGTQGITSGTIVRTFTIQNTGTSTLNISSVNITGTAASDYSVTAAPAATVAAAGSTTFQVTFDPSTIGARNATITINNNDCNEGTYNFAITGTGLFMVPTITFNPASTKTYGDPDFEINASSNSTEPITYSSSNNSVATVTKNTSDNKWYVHIVSIGTVTLTASQDAGPSYAAGSANATLTITPAILTINADPKTKTYGTADPALTYVATGFVNGENNSLVTGGLKRVAGEDAGEYPIEQNTLSAGNNYSINYTGNKLTITKASQTISWSQSLTIGCNGGDPIQLTATSSSGLPVSYAVTNTAIATVSGNLLTPVQQGTTTVTATQAGDENYLAATAVINTFNYTSSNLVKQHFSDALFFVNDSNSYVQWQWYKNDVAVSGATQPYYSETAPLNGAYYVVATDKNGNSISTCPLLLTGNNVLVKRLKISPNPVKPGFIANVTCDFTSEELQDAKLVIADIQGTIVKQQTNIQPITKVQMPLIGGVYIVALIMTNGQKETINVLVR